MFSWLRGRLIAISVKKLAKYLLAYYHYLLVEAKFYDEFEFSSQIESSLSYKFFDLKTGCV